MTAEPETTIPGTTTPESTPPETADPGIPALLRAARGAYGNAVRSQLTLIGCDDVPRNGAFLLGGIANYGAPVGGLIRQLGVSKQAASQLIDTLVLRGYLERRVDPDDRRRVVVDVTEHGRAAAAAIRDAVEDTDAELAQLISADDLGGLRRGLAALTTIRERHEASAHAASDHA